MDRSKPIGRGAPLRRGAPLTRGTPLGRGSRIAPVSAKRLAERDDRAEVRTATFARDGWRCVAHALVPSAPCTAGLECDEEQGRGRNPGSHLDPFATQSLCTICHRIKTERPAIAGVLGLYGLNERALRLDRIVTESGPAAAGVATVDALISWCTIKHRMLGIDRPPSIAVAALTTMLTRKLVIAAEHALELSAANLQ